MPMIAARAAAVRRPAAAIVVGKVRVKASSRLTFFDQALLVIFKNV